MMGPLPWLALGSVKGVGNVFIKRLLNRFQGPDEIFGATEAELGQVEGARPQAVAAILGFDGWDDARRELERAHDFGVEVMGFDDPGYPPHLREIHDPPPVLYVKGTLIAEDKLAISIVGSRQATSVGKQVTYRSARSLASRGITVVSGGARGIDTEAHRGALSARGRTICVLGCGIDLCYPPENGELYDMIAGSGAVISEFPMGTQPEPNNFPRRNRIISGISLGVMVVEAAGDSGSLITASYALEQGREVYAVPGSVSSPTSRGTNSLIKRGAKLVEGPEDIITDLFPSMKGFLREFGANDTQFHMDSLDADEKAIYDCITGEPVHIDALVSGSGFSASRALTLLLGMELKGAVKQVAGMRFIRACV
jgi:DNA processing protein